MLETNPSSIDCVIDGNLVRCAGTLSPATCEASTDGNPEVTRETEWVHFFTPTEEIPDEERHLSQALSSIVSAEAAAEPFCVQLARDEPSDESHIWFELISVNANQRRVSFTSPIETLKRIATTRYDTGSHRIDAHFETSVESGYARICTTLQEETCGL